MIYASKFINFGIKFIPKIVDIHEYLKIRSKWWRIILVILMCDKCSLVGEFWVKIHKDMAVWNWSFWGKKISIQKYGFKIVASRIFGQLP
jgi:hypothetical protein